MEAANQSSSPGLTLRRLIFWDFPRASWRYDVVVGIILLFIFAIPREFFHDQPRASGVILMSSAHGAQRVFIASELLAGRSNEEQIKLSEKLIHERTGKTWHVVRVEPITDQADADIKGYIAYTAQ